MVSVSLEPLCCAIFTAMQILDLLIRMTWPHVIPSTLDAIFVPPSHTPAGQIVLTLPLEDVV